MPDRPPPPGSPAAVARGCTCPVDDNAHGQGYLGGMKSPEGNPMYVVQQDCPLHGSQRPER